MSKTSPYEKPSELPHSSGETSSYWPDFSLFSVALIWGINIPIMKNGLDEVDPYVFNAIRLAVSVIVLLTFAIRERMGGRRIEEGLSWKQIVVYSVIVSGFYQLLFLLGISRTTSGNTALIISTIPMWTALLARVFLKERLLKVAWLGLLIALSGTVLVALQKGDVNVGGQHLVGNLCILGAALAWSIGTVNSRPLLKRSHRCSCQPSRQPWPCRFIWRLPGVVTRQAGRRCSLRKFG